MANRGLVTEQTERALRATTVEEKLDALAHAIAALATFVGNVEDKLSAELDAVRHRLR